LNRRLPRLGRGTGSDLGKSEATHLQSGGKCGNTKELVGGHWGPSMKDVEQFPGRVVRGERLWRVVVRIWAFCDVLT
jgi:hypothetical protein